MNALKLLPTKAGAASAVAIAALVLGLLAAQPVAAAGWDTSPVDAGVDQQTVPEPADPANPGDVPGGDAAPGEGAVADGGSATPWVAIGVGVLLVLALAAAVWASRKPTISTETDLRDNTTDHRYIPPM